MKVCKICNLEKDLSDFNKRDNDRYRNECKECRKKYSIHYRKGNNNNPYIMGKSHKICNTCGLKKEIDEFVKQKCMCKLCKSDYLKKYYQLNKEKQLNRAKNRYAMDSDNIKSKNREYSKNNRDKINKRSKIYKEEVLSKDTLFNLKNRIGTSIRRILKSKEISKKYNTSDFIGCDFNELKHHIEMQFTEGMNWENKELWHLDHIIPISIATTEDEVFLLSHYTNLRPMWSRDNILKSNRVEDFTHPIYLKLLEKRKSLEDNQDFFL